MFSIKRKTSNPWNSNCLKVSYFFPKNFGYFIIKVVIIKHFFSSILYKLTIATFSFITAYYNKSLLLRVHLYISIRNSYKVIFYGSNLVKFVCNIGNKPWVLGYYLYNTYFFSDREHNC